MKSFLIEMEYVVDMQGFKQPSNDFILKELAIVPLEGDTEPLVLLFKPPFSWRRLSDKYKRENRWLERCYHGIGWTSGSIDYEEIGNILREALHDATKVIVMGSIKKKWLERFKFEVHDAAEMGYPPLDKLKLVTVCPNHNGAYRASCALHNVRLMKKFLEESNIPLETSDRSSVMDWE